MNTGIKEIPISVLKQNNADVMPLSSEIEETNKTKQTSVRTAEQVTRDRRMQVQYKQGGE